MDSKSFWERGRLLSVTTIFWFWFDSNAIRLNFYSNSSTLRILDRYNFCFFNIEENKKITVFV